MEYSINTEYVDIIAGTSNRYSSIYEAVSKDVDQNNDKGMKYLKNFLQSIENISKKENVKDERITKSAGNIKNFQGYENIVSANNFLKKNLGSVKGVKDCNEMFDLLEKFQPEYSDGYDKKNRIVILEYESAVYMLVTNLSMIIANNMDVVSNGTEIRIKQKSEETFGVIPKAMSDLLKQMKNPNHKAYLAELNKTISNEPAKKISPEEKVTTEGVYSEDVFMEDPLGVVNTISQVGTLTWQIVVNLGMNIKGGLAAFKKLRHTIFGIVPVIRSISYLRYKKKADTILALDQQVSFIQSNIDQLEKRTNMDPAKKATIIKKQQAAIEAYKKKSAKLRAQLMETEKEASTAIAKEDPQMKNTDDDFVLESGKTIKEIFTESSNDEVS